MATFSQWLKDQESRPDEIGAAASAWGRLTPGRISSVSGIIRYMEHRLSESGRGADDADVAVLTSVVEGIRKAADEYNRIQVRKEAERAGVIPFTPPQPDDSSQLVAPAGQEAGPNVHSVSTAAPQGAKYTGWPEARFDRIEHKLDLLIRIVGALASDATSELMQKLGVADSEEESTERGVALWIRRDGSIDFELLFRMADLTP